MEQRTKKLLDQVRDAIRLKHYSIRTEESYVTWIKRYILFHHKRHPNAMGSAEIEAFLTHQAVNQQGAASTQDQALSALLSVSRRTQNAARPLRRCYSCQKSKRLPTVLTKDETLNVIERLSGTPGTLRAQRGENHHGVYTCTESR